MADPYFFGYGSLVNTATHDFPNPKTAQLAGWRRAWRPTEQRQVAFLTAIPDPECEIDGMIAHVPDDDWDALDQREWAYERVRVTNVVSHPLTHPVEIAVYIVAESGQPRKRQNHPILLSYLDVVVQGYLRAFGPEAANRFFETTSGWDLPILNDRAAPRYPRHQALSPDETTFVDAWLPRLPSIVKQLDQTGPALK